MSRTFKLTDLRSMPAIKQQAYQEPVMLTNNGAVEFVFMTIGQYNDLLKAAKHERSRKDKSGA